MTDQAVIWALIPAAGFGARMESDTPKQYLRLLHQPVLAHTIERLASFRALAGVWVGISENDKSWDGVKDLVAHLPVKVESYIGGKERANTVLNGLAALADHANEHDWVLVHDAARPCVRHEDISLLIETAMTHADGGLLALPEADTVKRVDKHGAVIETVDRAELWRAMTPQLFPLRQLHKALEKALADKMIITDEASAIEHAGGSPQVIVGRADNIKITYPDDLPLAEMLLKRQMYEGES